MGGAGDSPAPVGDPPTGTALSHVAKRPFSLPRIVVSVPSGGSPDGTGGSPVLPGNHFPNTLLAGSMQVANGERRRPLSAVLLRRTGLDRCRGRPADAPAVIAYGHRSVIGFCRPICSARGRTERPGRPVLRSATEGGSRSPFPTASFQLGCWSRGGGGRQACRRIGASSPAEFG